MTRSTQSSSSSFSLDAYERAKKRLSELTAAKSQAQGQYDDSNNKKHKVTRKRSPPASSTSGGNSNNQQYPPDPPEQGDGLVLSPSSEDIEGEEEEMEEVDFELSQMEKKLLASIKTAGMRPAREHALLELAQEVSQRRRDMMERNKAQSDKWKCRARGLIRRLQGRVKHQVEELRAAELSVEEMRDDIDKRIRRVMEEADKKIQTSKAAMHKELEEERQRAEEKIEKERKQYEQEIVAEMEDKMIRDLERTKNRLKRESKDKIDGVISRLEEEFHESMTIHDAALRKAMLSEAEALTKVERMEEENTDLVSKIQMMEEDNTELTNKVAQLQSQLTQQQIVQAKTEARIKELESSFTEVVEGLKLQAEEAHRQHQQDKHAWEDKRKKELQQVDELVRTKITTKDQVISRLKEELSRSQKDAQAAHNMLKEIQLGFREV